MKNNNAMFVTLKFLTLATVFTMTMAFPFKLMAATWTLGQGVGECYKDDKRVGGAKYCHNCKTNQEGNQVKWTFEALCDENLAGHVAASLDCGKNTPSEGVQLRALQAEAEKSLPSSSKKKCPTPK